MKITVNQLRRIIKEEVEKVMKMDEMEIDEETQLEEEDDGDDLPDEEAEEAKGPGVEFVKSTAKKINSAIESEQDPGLRKALLSIRSAMYDNSVVGKILKSAGITYNA